MNLSERKKKILSAVIDENVATAEPVSSGQLQKEYLTELSSATIRNELATLEEMGLLYQPHTSAGRLPTMEGLKLYIDEILPTINSDETAELIGSFDAKLDNISGMLKQTARAISEATNYTSIMYIGLYDFAKIDEVKLQRIDDRHVVGAIITDRGVIHDVLELSLDAGDDKNASKILTQIFKGKTLRQIERSDFYITQEFEKYKFMFELMVAMIARQEKSQEPIAIEGKDKLFNFPEFSRVENIKSAFGVFDDPEKLVPILNDDEGSVEIKVEIGDDDKSPIKNCAIVTASYKVGGKTVGRAGVMGPARMDYKNVISILKGISSEITRRLESPDKD